MTELDVFRQDLAGLMHKCAADRRHALGGGRASGEDLKIIALFDRLAIDAETLDARVAAACRERLRHASLTRCLLQRSDDLLAQVGVLVWPADAAALVEWLTAQIAPAGSDRDPPASAPPRPTRESSGLRVWAGDFSAGVSIVAPLLAARQVALAIGQMHDRAVVQTEAAVPALVVAAQATGGGRSVNAGSTLTLTFQPSPAAGLCRVMVHSDYPAAAVALGQTLSVVPRAATCAAPLIPAQIGDPAQALGLSVALLAGGLAALAAWARLRSAPSPAFARPAWS